MRQFFHALMSSLNEQNDALFCDKTLLKSAVKNKEAVLTQKRHN